MSIESVLPSNHLTHCRPLLLPPSVVPSIGAFSNELLRVPWKTRSQDAGPKAAVPTARHAPWMSFLCLASEPRLQGARGGNPLLGRAALPLRRPTGTPRLEWRGCGPSQQQAFSHGAQPSPGTRGIGAPEAAALLSPSCLGSCCSDPLDQDAPHLPGPHLSVVRTRLCPSKAGPAGQLQNPPSPLPALGSRGVLRRGRCRVRVGLPPQAPWRAGMW